jgi:putative FmdB family regulatory protein
MPVYEYQCGACGHEFEEWQKIKDPPVKTCPKCAKDEVQRLISQTAFQLKGGGWYKDLYSSSKSNGKAETKADSKAGSDSSGKSDGKAAADKGGKSDSKPAAGGGSESKASGSSGASSSGSSGSSGGGTTTK